MDQRGGLKKRCEVLVEQEGIPVVATSGSGGPFPDRVFNLFLTRRRFPRPIVVSRRQAITIAPPSDIKLDKVTIGMLVGIPTVTPTGTWVGGVADRPGHLRTSTLLKTVARNIFRAPPGAVIGAFLPLRLGRRGSDEDAADQTVDSPDRTGSPLAMTHLDVALSSIHDSLLADVSLVVAAGPAGSAQDASRHSSSRTRIRVGARERRAGAGGPHSRHCHHRRCSRPFLRPTGTSMRPRRPEPKRRCSNARKTTSWPY